MVLVEFVCILQCMYIATYSSPQSSIVPSYNFNTIAVCRHTKNNFYRWFPNVSHVSFLHECVIRRQLYSRFFFCFERNSFFYLLALLALYFAHSCTKCRFRLLLAEVKPCSLKTIYTTIVWRHSSVTMETLFCYHG